MHSTTTTVTTSTTTTTTTKKTVDPPDSDRSGTSIEVKITRNRLPISKAVCARSAIKSTKRRATVPLERSHVGTPFASSALC